MRKGSALGRSLSRRLTFSAALCGLLGFAATEMIDFYALRRVAEHRFEPLASYTLHVYEHAKCEESPAAWQLEFGPENECFAYDARTHLSANPHAPPFDSAAFAALAAGDTFGHYLHLFSRMSVTTIRVSTSGPCALTQSRWTPQRGLLATPVVIGVVLLLACAIAAVQFLVVRPLLRRMQALRAAAENAGDRSYVAAPHLGFDEIDDVARGLDRAHARMIADGRSLLARQEQMQQYLSDVSHDLRTPISALQIALERAADNGAEAPHLLKQALGDVVYIAGLTTNLRLASQLRDGLYEGDAEVNLTDTVERVAVRGRIFAHTRGIALEVATPEHAVILRAHPVAIEQAIANIVDNAVAHGDSGGHVAVVLALEAHEFVFTVMDDGPGVAPTELPRLGERTFRSDEARRRDPRGSGLGLAITAEVCVRSGFTLAFSAVEPRGLRVRIRGSWLTVV